MRRLDDPQLVLLVQATGDVKAYEELVRRHQPGLLAFLASLSGDSPQVDDAMQRALLKAYQKIEQFGHRSSFKTWLYKIAYREMAMLHRREPPPSATAPGHERSAPAVEVPTHDLKLDLQAALTELSPEERTAVIMCDAFELSHREAADAMARPLGTVKTYVRRARAKLARALGLETDDE